MRIASAPRMAAKAIWARTIGRRSMFLALGALMHLAGLAGTSVSHAQVDAATAQQAAAAMAVSPYLNLQGNVYSNLPTFQMQVQPYTETQGALGRQADQIQGLQRRSAQPSGSGSRTARQRNSTFGGRNASALVTGHPTRFMTYSHYYPATGGRRR